jgi:Fungal Transforming acidic coiled-coil (TACC) proteins
MPTPKSRAKYNDKSLSELISSALDAERDRWTQDSNMRHAAEMEALAADLHTQYREKHTRKVEALKLTYKKQYDKKVSTLEDKVQELESSIEELRAELKRETDEKKELIEMSEELMRLTSAGNQE